jgi:hypothetical protein
MKTRLTLPLAAGLIAAAMFTSRPATVLANHGIGQRATATYTCPMHCEGPKTYDTPGTCPVCGMHRKLQGAPPYSVDITRDGTRLRAGEETLLRITLRDPDGEPVRNLEVVHEKLLHLLMTSADLSWFAHEHPERQPDGTFELRMAFPAPGGYTLFHDFTPERVGMQVAAVELTVPGPGPSPRALVPDADREKTVDGYSVRFATADALTASRPVAITIAISRDGTPVRDLEPYLGAMGHMIVVSEDRANFVHSHPTDAGPAAAARGPELTFQAEFPTRGLYKSWTQFQRAGRVITVPFTFRVQPAPAPTTSPGPS